PARAHLEAAVKVLIERGVSLDAALAELRRLFAEKSGERAFLIPAEDVFEIKGRGTVVTSASRTESVRELEASGGGSASASQPLTAKLKLKAAPETEVQAENLKTGEVLKG